ncbi:MAG: hypothetical protein HOU81_02555 [Hamadaea sp.]|uniref:DUF6223 family protein n=1 Tax=Hamadaea sp. TaxID=2024425 RepID=UPI00183F14AC|nr:DUF6223 family protein [Hamadaea sp.]NUR69677.1 hypothetical protein [Hamadaea sp.]NUT19544.1 hypothetical protein [Hamadaea sp.]
MNTHMTTAVAAYTLTTGRLFGTAAALLALAGAVLGVLALRRPARRRATTALATGILGLIVGGFVVGLAKGGPGTGYGVVGGWAALAIGLIATVTGGLALARARNA